MSAYRQGHWMNWRDGDGRQKCTLCGARSVAGLSAGMGKCRYHWAKGTVGKAWAERLEREARRVAALAKAKGGT